MKVYELIIPFWSAIGRDYPDLEIDTGNGFAAVDAEFRILQGARLRGAPDLLERMQEQGFVKEVEE